MGYRDEEDTVEERGGTVTQHSGSRHTRAGERLALIRSLFPDLSERLDAAYARHTEDDRALRGEDGQHHHPERRDAAGFDAWLDGEAAALREGELAGAAFPSVRDPGARTRFEHAFSAIRAAAASWGGPVPPEPEDFAEAGVDFEALGETLVRDPSLLPVPAPHGMGAEAWAALFSRAARQQGSPFAEAAPLVFAAEALSDFALLDAVPDPRTPVVERPGPDPSGGRRDVVRWTLRLVPAEAAPPVLGLSFDHGPHPSLPEMLTLQLARVASGEDPVDARSFTWLAGSIADGRLAARHIYDEGERAIRVNCREPGNQGPHLGARPPIG